MNIIASQSIERVADQITSLHSGISGLGQLMYDEMYNLKSSMEIRLMAIETKLGIFDKMQELIKATIIEYTFKTVWIILAIGILFVVGPYVLI